MELRQLEYFVAVAEEANFTRAAARVRVAQPGVSAQIRQLERQLGQPLLDRSGRTVRLTDVGAAVLPYARAALGAVAGAQSAVDELSGLMRGRVAVGMVTSCLSVDLTKLLARFHREHPAVEITLAEANSDQLLEGLRSGRLDLALVGLAGTPPQGIETQVVADEALVAAVGPHHALAGSARITLREAGKQALISLPPGTGLRACLDEACAATGVQPRIAFEASNPNMLAELAVGGLGVAILPDTVAKAHQASLHAIEITRPQLRSRLELAWRAEGPVSPAARALIGHARLSLASA